MGKKDPRVDAYIAHSAEFAKPVLRHLRKLIHKGCPEIEEAIKWSFACFMYKGILCSIAGFKHHCTFGFWASELIVEKGNQKSQEAMGNFGRITKMSDLPGDAEILRYIRKAVALRDAGIKPAARKRSDVKKELRVPIYIVQAIKKNKKAMKTFEGFNYSNKKEYVEWVTEAKTEKTRTDRLTTAVQWMAEGKIRNWKYVR